MPSPTRRKSLGNGLLEYDPTYRVLICRKCDYAIQKSAIDGHLLRHKIYREDRRRLLRLIENLELLEPDDVPVPVSDSAPIATLPVFSAYRCICPWMPASGGHVETGEGALARGSR